jgi:RimJ/RimL family protein N-acetyltransferase
MFNIGTERLILRDMQQSDESAFVAMSQNSEYQRYYCEPDCLPENYQRLTSLFIRQSKEQPRTAYSLAMELKSNLRFVGVCCLRLEAEQQASIGFSLDAGQQGYGLMHEAMDCLIQYVLSHHDVHRIYAETISENSAAIALCRRLGLEQDAVLKENRFFKGRYWDTVVMAMLLPYCSA